jgi:ParB-like chromosome segregation protein Spo0J
MATRVKISEIRIETRYRYDMGDIAGLAASMADVGQLQPVVITPDGLLVAGERRLAAARSLGWDDVKVHIITSFTDAADLLRAERDENTCRKEMTMSELVAIGKRLEELERPKAAERMSSAGKVGAEKRWGDGVGSGETTPSEPYRRATEVVGEALGISRAQYERARDVVAATNDPDPVVAEVAKEAAREMDETGKVRPAYEKVRAAKAPGPKPPKPPRYGGNRKRHLQVIESIAASLSGLAIVADEITELDQTVTCEEATRLSGDLSKSLAALRRLNNLLNKENTK